VIEDSPRGVSAAIAAGMSVYGFSGGSHRHHDPAARDLLAAGASLVFDDFSALPGLIGAAATNSP